MKRKWNKALSLLLTLCMLAAAAACAKTAEEAPAPEEPLEVTLVVPGYVVDGVQMKTDLTKEQPGLVSTKDPTRDNYTLRMSKTMYESVKEQYKTAVSDALGDFKDGENFQSISDITHSDDFTAVTLQVDKDAFVHGPDAVSLMAIGLVSSSYQYIIGTQEDKIKVVMSVEAQDDGKVLLSATYPDSFRK